MSTVKLRTGKEAIEPMVKVVSLSLQTLMAENPIVLYELAEKCKDSSHELFGKSGDLLRELSLIESNGSVRDIVQDIVLASIEGEGLEMHLVNPIGVLTADETQAERISAEPGNLMDFELFKLVHRVAEIVYECIGQAFTSDRCPMNDRRKDGANPYYNQTASGIFLEMYYGLPSSLWTPWGKWSIGGGGSGGREWEKVMELLHDRLGITVYKPVRNETIGTIGPVYFVTKLDDQVLPPPVELARGNYQSYDDVNKAWAELSKKCSY